MMQVSALISTVHADARSVASSLAPDNLKGMTTTADGDRVTTVIHGTQIRSVIASVDDYLMNLELRMRRQGSREKRQEQTKRGNEKNLES